MRSCIRPSLGSMLAIAIALAVSTPARGGVCPASRYLVTGTTPVTTTAGTFEADDSGHHVAADLGQGHVEMSQPGTLATTWVDAADAYDVSGVAPGTAVPLTALFDVNGSVSTPGCGGSGCSGYVTIRITHGAAYAETTYSIGLFNGSQSFHDVRRLPVTIVAGTPEVVSFKLLGGRAPGGDHASEGRGQIGFADLPAGVAVISCQGFGGATPVSRRSWGALKTIYR